MDFNNRKFGDIKDSLTKSPYTASSETGLPSPPIGDFFLIDDGVAEDFLLDDSGDNLVTP